MILNIPCYYDTGPDTAKVTIAGYTVGASNYINIYTPSNISSEVNNSQRHGGIYNTSKYRLETTSEPSITSSLNYTHIDGLQIKLTLYTEYDARIIYNDYHNYVNISNNILVQNLSGTPYGRTIFTFGDKTKIWNNIMYSIGSAKGEGIHQGTAGTNTYASNNTLVGLSYGFFAANDNIVAKNNITQNCTDGFYGTFTGADYNISNLASDAPGAHSKNSTVVNFVDTTNKNFHLTASDSSAKNAGADLSADPNLAFTTDIDGQTRNLDGAGWDIGADEKLPDPVYFSVGTAVVTTPPVASYDFNEGYGGTAHNGGSLGATADGTLQSGGSGGNATSTAMWDKNGKNGGAMEFDGTNDYVSVSDNSSLKPALLTISVWIKPNSIASAQTILSKGKAVGTSYILGFGVAQNADKLEFCSYNSGSWKCSNINSSSIPIGSWTHIVGTFDGGNLRLYVNGVAQTPVALSSLNYTTPYSLTLGRYVPEIGGGNYFNGLIDDVKIYNYALTPAQVNTLYNNNSALSLGNDASRNNNGTAVTGANKDYCIPGDTAQCDKPVGEWKFDTGSGTTAYDTSGNGNNSSTLSGATWTQGKFGKGLSFNGSGNGVILSSWLTLGADFTISTWFNKADSSAIRMLLSQDDSSAAKIFFQTDDTLGIRATTS